MNNFISTIAFCFILATGLVGAETFVEYCSQCVASSETSGHYPHPNRCDGYIHCYKDNYNMNAIVQWCGLGTLFDAKTKTCNHAALAKCDAICTSGTKFKVEATCNQYYICINNKFDRNVQTCPLKKAFDEISSDCVPDINCPTITPVDCSGFTLTGNPQVYLHGTVKKSCAEGFIFNLTLCTCVHVNTTLESNVCILINLTMTTDFLESSKNRAVLNTNAIISNGAAYFDGTSFIVIPSFSNNDFGVKLAISIDIYIETVPQNKVAILSNGNCDLAPTVSIILTNALTNNPTLEATLEIEDVKITTVLKTGISFNKWITIELIKTEDTITLLKDGFQAASKSVTGQFLYQDGSMVLGKSPQIGLFNGYMRNLIVTKCPV